MNLEMRAFSVAVRETAQALVRVGSFLQGSNVANQQSTTLLVVEFIEPSCSFSVVLTTLTC